MPKCNTCGHNCDEGDVFCIKCGNKIDNSKPIDEPVSKSVYEKPSKIINDDNKLNKKNIKKLDNDSRKERIQFNFEVNEISNVYESHSRTKKAKLIFYSILILIILSVLIVGFSLINNLLFNESNSTKNINSKITYNQTINELNTESEENNNKLKLEYTKEELIEKNCPFECCINEQNYSNKICDNNLDCINNKCVQSNCPYDCCINSKVFEDKKCEGDASCVNNKCIKKPCPKDYECCYDEIEYQDKDCNAGQLCINKECKTAFIELSKKYFSNIKKFFIGE
jgi:hypothetical protein